MRRALLVGILAACAPEIGGPADHQRAADRADGDRLAAQLAALPGAVRADVTLHRAVVDPFLPPTPSSAAIVIVIDERADRAAITTAARQLVHATAPDVAAPQLAIELGVRPDVPRERPLRGALIAVLGLVAALAAWIAVRER